MQKFTILLIFILFTSLQAFAQLVPQEDSNEKVGFVNEAGQYVIKAQFDDAGNFDNGIARVQKGSKYGFINEIGEYVVKPKYSSVGIYNEFGLAKVSVGGKNNSQTGELDGAKWGFINRSAIEVIPPKYSVAGEFGENGITYVAVGTKTTYNYVNGESVQRTVGKKKGFINKDGVLLTKIQYDMVQTNFTYGRAMVEMKDKKGYINEQGQEVVPLKYDVAYSFTDLLAAVAVRNSKNTYNWGFIDTDGNEVVPVSYEHLYLFYNGIAAIKQSGKWAFIDNTGKNLTDFVYSDLIQYTDIPFVYVTKDGKAESFKIKNGTWGLMNNKGEMLTPLKYTDIKPFNKVNLAMVSNGEYWGWINKKGKEVIPLKHSGAIDFQDGIAIVLNNGKINYIDSLNKILLKTDYIDATTFENGVSRVKNSEEKWGGIDIKGKTIVPFFAENATEVRNIIEQFYIRKQKPLTQRDVKLYKLYESKEMNKFKIVDTIPQDMWDY
ncbi:MAG: WG repeat-containing protein [Prevotellaceae bacterium]|jgi:hypothetical protein|nr:WG repeat-containing protein [Prevotellaceae bacterium]